MKNIGSARSGPRRPSALSRHMKLEQTPRRTLETRGPLASLKDLRAALKGRQALVSSGRTPKAVGPADRSMYVEARTELSREGKLRPKARRMGRNPRYFSIMRDIAARLQAEVNFPPAIAGRTPFSTARRPANGKESPIAGNSFPSAKGGGLLRRGANPSQRPSRRQREVGGEPQTARSWALPTHWPVRGLR